MASGKQSIVAHDRVTVANAIDPVLHRRGQEARVFELGSRMPLKSTPSFSRREREIMDVMHLLGPATAAEIHAALGDPPTYSSVRATLRRLEEKGHVKHRDQGHRNVYAPIVSQTRARKAAARQLIETYFGGSVGGAVEGLIDSVGQKRLSRREIARATAALQRVRAKA